MRNPKLTYGIFLTIITQIKGIVNSNPFITVITDKAALTSGHFLIGRPINSTAELEVTKIHDTKLKLCKKQQKRFKLFRKNGPAFICIPYNKDEDGCSRKY